MKCRVTPLTTARGGVLRVVEEVTAVIEGEEEEMEEEKEEEESDEEDGSCLELLKNVDGSVEDTNTNDNKYTYKCRCGKQFRRLATLQRHAEMAHPVDESFKCAECDRTFTTAHKLTIHRLSAHVKGGGGGDENKAGGVHQDGGKTRPGRPRVIPLRKNPAVVKEVVVASEKTVPVAEETIRLDPAELQASTNRQNQEIVHETQIDSFAQNQIFTSQSSQSDVTNVLQRSYAAPPQTIKSSMPADSLVLQKIIQLPPGVNGVLKTDVNDANDNTLVFFDKNSGSFMKAFAVPWWKVCNDAAGGPPLTTANSFERDVITEAHDNDASAISLDDVDSLQARLDIKQLELLDSEAIVQATRAAVAKHSMMSSFTSVYAGGITAAKVRAASLPGGVTLIRAGAVASAAARATVTNSATGTLSLAAPSSSSIIPGCGSARELTTTTTTTTSRNLSITAGAAAVAAATPLTSRTTGVPAVVGSNAINGGGGGMYNHRFPAPASRMVSVQTATPSLKRRGGSSSETDDDNNAMSRNEAASCSYSLGLAARVENNNNISTAVLTAARDIQQQQQQLQQQIASKVIAYTQPSPVPATLATTTKAPVQSGGAGVAIRGVVTVNRAAGFAGGLGQRPPQILAVSSGATAGFTRLPVRFGGVSQQLVYSGSALINSNQSACTGAHVGAGAQVAPQQTLRLVPAIGKNFTAVNVGNAPVNVSKEVAFQNKATASVDSSDVANQSWLNKLSAQSFALMQRSGVRFRLQGQDGAAFTVASEDGGPPETKYMRVGTNNDVAATSRGVSLFTAPNQGDGDATRRGQDAGGTFGFNPEPSKVILANLEYFLQNQLSPRLIVSAATVNSLKIYTCTTCGKDFISEKYLSMHVSLHRDAYYNEGPTTQEGTTAGGNSNGGGAGITAVVSGNGFSVTAGGMELSNGESPIRRSAKGTVAQWTCKICEKTFAQNSNYKNHIRTHTNDRPFVCEICSIGFKERYHLKKHVLFKHSSEQKEECRFCGKRFKDSTAVRAHERTHSDQRPYACLRCDKTFKTSECLWHHENRSKTCGKSLGELPASLGGTGFPDAPGQRTRRSRLPRQPRMPLEPSEVSLAIQQLQQIDQTNQHREQLQQQQQQQEAEYQQQQQLQQQQQEADYHHQLQQQQQDDDYQQQLLQQQFEIQLHQQMNDTECLDLDMQSLYNDSSLPQIPIYSHCEVVTESSSSQVLTNDPPARVLLGPVMTGGYPVEFHNALIQSELDPTMPVVKVESAEMELFDYNLAAMSPSQPAYLGECYTDDFELDLVDSEEEEDEEDSSSPVRGGTTELNSDTTDSDTTTRSGRIASMGEEEAAVAQFSNLTGGMSWGYPVACSTAAGVEGGEEMVSMGSRRDCEQCGKRFSTLSALEKHAIVHNEDRPFRCEECNSGFKLKVHLKKHTLYRHSNEYPCECSICGKRFKDSSAVRLHERIHSEARPFPCICGKSFKTRENLWGHRNRGPCERSVGDDFLLANLRVFQSDIGPIWGVPLSAAAAAAAGAGMPGGGGVGANVAGSSPAGGGGGDSMQHSDNFLMKSSSNFIDSSSIATRLSKTEVELHEELFFTNSTSSSSRVATTTAAASAAATQHAQLASSRALPLSSAPYLAASAVGNTSINNRPFIGRTTLTSYQAVQSNPAVTAGQQKQPQQLTAIASAADSAINDMQHDQLVAFISSIMNNGYAKTPCDTATLQTLSTLFESSQSQSLANTSSVSKSVRTCSAVGGATGGLVVTSCTSSSTASSSAGAYLPTAVVVPIKREKTVVLSSPAPPPPPPPTTTAQDGANITTETAEPLYSLPPFETLVAAHPHCSPPLSSGKYESTASPPASASEIFPATGISMSAADKYTSVKSPRSTDTMRLPGIQQLLLTHSLSSPQAAAGNSRSSTPLGGSSARVGSPSSSVGDGALKQQTFFSNQEGVVGGQNRSQLYATNIIGLPPPPPYQENAKALSGGGISSPAAEENDYVSTCSRRAIGSPPVQVAAVGGLNGWATSEMSFGDLPVTSSY